MFRPSYWKISTAISCLMKKREGLTDVSLSLFESRYETNYLVQAKVPEDWTVMTYCTPEETVIVVLTTALLSMV